MVDSFGRQINYLRLSITDRCNLRCFYCTHWGSWEKLPAPEILRYEEFLRLARVAAQVGLNKIRVTGGEPLMRRGVVDFLGNLKEVTGVEEVCLTTNGLLLAEMAADLYAAGLRHLNVSLDTLKRDRYRQLTGSDNLLQVRAGLARATDLGFRPLKLNFVVLKGINDDELGDFALLARDYPWQVRFIEFMPTVSQRRWIHHFLPMAEVLVRLAALGPMETLARRPTDGPARIVRLPGFAGELGFISPMSQHQCSACNRLRLTCSGRLRPCLFAAPEIDLKGPLRQGATEAELGEIFQEAIRRKPVAPKFNSLESPFSCRPMVTIGG